MARPEEFRLKRFRLPMDDGDAEATDLEAFAYVVLAAALILPPMGELDQGQCFRLPLKGQLTLFYCVLLSILIRRSFGNFL